MWCETSRLHRHSFSRTTRQSSIQYSKNRQSIRRKTAHGACYANWRTALVGSTGYFAGRATLSEALTRKLASRYKKRGLQQNLWVKSSEQTLMFSSGITIGFF